MLRRIMLTVLALTACLIFTTGNVLAAPESLTGKEKSKAVLVELSKPDEDFSTFSDTCIISGKSEEGVRLVIYIGNDEDTYEKLTVDDEVVAWKVGVSGIFAKEIGLKRNAVNKIIIYAEKDNQFQIIKREITVKDLALKEVLKNEVVKIENLITKILGE